MLEKKVNLYIKVTLNGAIWQMKGNIKWHEDKTKQGKRIKKFHWNEK